MSPSLSKTRVADFLIPKLATHETITQALYRLAQTSGDTHLDLAAWETWGRIGVERMVR